jgi:hypothetical protein
MSIYKHTKVTNIEILVLGILGIMSIVSGYYFKDLFAGFGSDYFNSSITNISSN